MLLLLIWSSLYNCLEEYRSFLQAAANAGTSAKTVSGRIYVHSSKLEEHISCCDMLLERQYETAPLDNDIYDLKKEIQDTIKRIIPAKTVISYAVSYTFNTLQQRLSSNKIGVIELENTIKAMTFLLALDEQQKVIESFLYIRELKKWLKQEWFEEIISVKKETDTKYRGKFSAYKPLTEVIEAVNIHKSGEKWPDIVFFEIETPLFKIAGSTPKAAKLFCDYYEIPGKENALHEAYKRYKKRKKKKNDTRSITG